MTQWYDKNKFRNYKIPKMCLGPGTPPPPAILKYSSDPGPSC